MPFVISTSPEKENINCPSFADKEISLICRLESFYTQNPFLFFHVFTTKTQSSKERNGRKNYIDDLTSITSPSPSNLYIKQLKCLDILMIARHSLIVNLFQFVSVRHYDKRYLTTHRSCNFLARKVFLTKIYFIFHYITLT